MLIIAAGCTTDPSTRVAVGMQWHEAKQLLHSCGAHPIVLQRLGGTDSATFHDYELSDGRILLFTVPHSSGAIARITLRESDKASKDIPPPTFTDVEEINLK
jgi:hypothetical protein